MFSQWITFPHHRLSLYYKDALQYIICTYFDVDEHYVLHSVHLCQNKLFIIHSHMEDKNVRARFGSLVHICPTVKKSWYWLAFWRLHICTRVWYCNILQYMSPRTKLFRYIYWNILEINSFLDIPASDHPISVLFRKQLTETIPFSIVILASTSVCACCLMQACRRNLGSWSCIGSRRKSPIGERPED